MHGGPQKNPENFSKIPAMDHEILAQVYDEPMGPIGQGVKRLNGVDILCWILLHTLRGRSRGLRNTFGRLPATWQPYEPENGRKERSGGSRGETGIRNMAATRFSDSATPTFDFSESRPKYTTTSGFANPLQV